MTELTGWKKSAADIIIAVITSDQVKEVLRTLVREELIPVLPVVAASTAKSAIDQIVKITPGLEGVVDLAKTASEAHDRLNDLFPNVDIPFIGNLGGLLGHH